MRGSSFPGPRPGAGSCNLLPPAGDFASIALATMAFFAVLLTPAAPGAAAGTTERVNVGPGGVQANDYSSDAAISADGRFVAFFSGATNLVRGAAGGSGSIFVRDRQAGRTELVSVGPGDMQGNQVSYLPAISADGRFVAFISNADNLVPGDTNEVGDVFVRDRQERRTERVSVATDDTQANEGHVFAVISPGGRYVAFASDASNLVPGDTNGWRDIFVRDRAIGRTRRVNVGRAGAQADDTSDHPTISAGGRFVGFLSTAGNLVQGDLNGLADIFIRDRLAGTTTRVRGPFGFGLGPAISTHGRIVAFASSITDLVPGDTNGATDVFVLDRQAGATSRVSVGPRGVQADGNSFDVAIAPGGRHVAFASEATNLVPGDTNGEQDIFVRDRPAGRTIRVSVATDGSQANGLSEGPAVSAGARFVAFASFATNLVPGDTNGTYDIFVRTR